MKQLPPATSKAPFIVLPYVAGLACRVGLPMSASVVRISTFKCATYDEHACR